MKKIFLIATIALFASCMGPMEKKQYDFEIIYTNGDTLETSYLGYGQNLFSLVNGDLTTNGKRTTLVSGVRSYRVKSIKSLGMETEAEAKKRGCGCDLKQITTE